MTERLQKLLSQRGVASRREAEELIRAGRVAVNGVPASLGEKADPETDRITLDGRPLPPPPGRVYILLNKPKGYVTTLSDELGRRNAAQLVSGCHQRVYPVGRLDMDSEGLLLFTNDGAFAQSLAHPRNEVEKGYRVWVTGFTAQSLDLLRRPVELDGRAIRPPEVELVHRDGTRAELMIVIHEGRNRQIRRMCGLAGLTVTRLRREREGSLTLGGLPEGRWRYLTPAEIAALLTETQQEG